MYFIILETFQLIISLKIFQIIFYSEDEKIDL